MTTTERRPITGLKGHPILDVANMLVKEANWNEDLGDKGYREKLIRKLVHQTPNRLYTSPDGKIARVLFFSDQHQSFQAYMETLDFNGDYWERYRSQFVSGTDGQSLEKDILLWRREFFMYEDVLGNPTGVFKVTETKDPEKDKYLHVVRNRGNPISCYYFIGASRQPYVMGIFRGPVLPFNAGVFRPIPNVPEETQNYSQPF